MSSVSCAHCGFAHCTVPLGNRRRFGPAPVEDTAPPQLAQPSPSAYPRPQPHRTDSEEQHDHSVSSNASGAFKHSLCKYGIYLP